MTTIPTETAPESSLPATPIQPLTTSITSDVSKHERPHWQVVAFLSTILFFIPFIGGFAAIFINSLPLGLAALIGYNTESVVFFLGLIPFFAALHGIAVSKLVSYFCLNKESRTQNVWLSLGVSTLLSIPGNYLFATAMNGPESMGPALALFMLLPVSIPVAMALRSNIRAIRANN